MSGSFFGSVDLKVLMLGIFCIFLGLTQKNHFEWDGILKGIEKEAQQEEVEEKKRKMGFAEKYPIISQVWGIRWIVKWAYKEGWWYSVGLMSIVLLGILLRLFYLDYLDGSDNYTIISIKNLYENGISFYKYSYVTTNLMLIFSKMFGYNLFSLRLPSIMYSFITLICVYLISKNFNKDVALISIFLFSMSPWSIVLSRVTRDYAFDCMVGSIILLISLMLFRKIINISKIEIMYLAFIPILIYFFSILNHRSQTLIVIIIPFITFLYIFYFFFESLYNKAHISNLNNKIGHLFDSVFPFMNKDNTYKIFHLLLLSLLPLAIAIIIYFVDYSNFKYGFRYNPFYFDVFFYPLVESPWQWFHNNYLSGLFIIPLFILPLILTKYLKTKKYFVLYLYSIFFFGLGLFMFKFASHINYYPTRYVYFLFPLYVIILSISLFYCFKYVNKIKMKTLFIVLFIILFFNFNSIYYAVNPIAAYDNENISNLKIDNIGLGRFDMYPVVDFIKNDLNWSKSTTFVFGGRYGEFIYLLDYEMDSERYLSRDNNVKYDVGKNMFVESSYFNYHELENATMTSKIGYFVTSDEYITDYENNRIQKLVHQNFMLYNTNIYFVQEINAFKIYRWDKTC